MVNGPHSGVAVIVLLAVLGFRFLATQRRRSGRPTGSRGFTAGPHQDRQHQGAEAVQHPSARDPAATGAASGPALGGTAPGWFRDPFVRHEQRYWSGSAWSEHVQDRGVPAVDPPPPTRGPAD
jgi:hypothetical protein